MASSSAAVLGASAAASAAARGSGVSWRPASKPRTRKAAVLVCSASSQQQREEGVTDIGDGSTSSSTPRPAAVGRRQALLAATVAASAAAAWAPAVVLPQPAEAADIVQRQQRSFFLGKLQKALRAEVEANEDLIPALLRLAINDAASYDKASKTGGPNGSIRLDDELERPENKGLKPALDLLARAKAATEAEVPQSGTLSYADVIQFGGQAAAKRLFRLAAIRKAGGDEKKGTDLYRAIGSEGQWGAFDKLFGREDATEADPAGRVPVWDQLSPAELKDKFASLGLKPRQIVPLTVFLSDDAQALEEKLAQDPEFEPLVTKYRKSRNTISQTDYEVDLIQSFIRLASLGSPVNTEAYTYALKRPSFKF